MTRKSMRSFRLSDETQKQIILVAAELGINQTEALEVSVSDFFRRLKSENPQKILEELAVLEGEDRDEALARQWDGVADLFEADEDLSQGLRDAVSRVARGTAESLRRDRPPRA